MPLALHTVDGRAQHALVYLAQELCRGVARPRKAAHPTGIRAAVIVEQALVVARRRHDLNAFAVAKRQDRQLGALEALLDQDRRLTKMLEELLQGDLRLCLV